MINLLDFDQTGLTALFAGRGEKPFRAKQTLRWIHRGLVDRVEAMTDLAQATRIALAGDAEIRAPAVVRDTTASDGTRKWLLDVGGANAIEAVYIPEDDRGTLCISSQAGCALDCAFCSTGKQGFNRNLGVGEIVGQLVARQPRAACRWCVDAMGRTGSASDHQCRDDGHGRAACQLRQCRRRDEHHAR